MRMLRVFAVLAAVLAGITFAQTVDVLRIGQWKQEAVGDVYAIASSGVYAYGTVEKGLQIFDMSNPTNVLVVGNQRETSGIVLSGHYGYAIGRGGFHVLDMSNPTNLMRLGGITDVGTRGQIAVSGRYAYVADGSFHVIDLLDPANPVRVGGAEMAASASSLAVSGTLVLVGTSLKSPALQAFDVSYPANPVPLGTITLPSVVESIAITGQYAYAATFSSALQVIDISDPANLVDVGDVTTSGRALVVVFFGNYAYCAVSNGLDVVEISDPASPVFIKHVPASFLGTVYDVAVSGTRAFISGSAGIRVLDISDPTNPVPIGGYVSRNSNARSVAQSGTYAYVADSNLGLQVIDISDPTRPTRVGGYYDFQKGSSPFDVALAGTHAYVLEGPNRLQVFDLNNPTNPVPVGVAQVPIRARRLAVADNYAYVIHDEPARIEDEQLREPRVGLTVFDISKPTNPVRRGSYSFTKGTSPAYGYGVNYLFAEDVVVSGDYAYVTYSGLDAMLLCAGHWRGTFPFGGIEVVDVSLPDNPVSRGGSFSWIAYFGMALVGNHLYAAYGTGYSCPPWAGGDSYTEGGLNVFSLSNPTNLVVVGGYKTNAYGSDIAVSGNYAYLVGSAPGFQVLDLSNPTNPVPVASYDPVGSKARVVAWGNYALVADGWAQGLQILSIRPVLFADRLGNQLRLKWGAGASDYILEGTTDLSAPQWQPVAGSPAVQDGFYQLNLPITESATFFRLRGQ
jgi:hypothetical protein